MKRTVILVLSVAYTCQSAVERLAGGWARVTVARRGAHTTAQTPLSSGPVPSVAAGEQSVGSG
jgi:hypothetical protein